MILLELQQQIEFHHLSILSHTVCFRFMLSYVCASCFRALASCSHPFHHVLVLDFCLSYACLSCSYALASCSHAFHHALVPNFSFPMLAYHALMLSFRALVSCNRLVLSHFSSCSLSDALCCFFSILFSCSFSSRFILFFRILSSSLVIVLCSHGLALRLCAL